VIIVRFRILETEYTLSKKKLNTPIIDIIFGFLETKKIKICFTFFGKMRKEGKNKEKKQQLHSQITDP